jgi:hypothetical protein
MQKVAFYLFMDKLELSKKTSGAATMTTANGRSRSQSRRFTGVKYFE